MVFGMPKEAIALGAVDEVLPIGAIASALLARLAFHERRKSDGTLKRKDGTPL